MSTETINVFTPVQEKIALPRDFVPRFNRAVWYTATKTRPFFQMQPNEVLAMGNGLQTWNKAYDGKDMLGVRLLRMQAELVFAAIHTDYSDAASQHGVTQLDIFEVGAPLNPTALFHELIGKRLERAELPRVRSDLAPVDPNIMPFIEDGREPLLSPYGIMRILEGFWPAINSETFRSYGSGLKN